MGVQSSAIRPLANCTGARKRVGESRKKSEKSSHKKKKGEKITDRSKMMMEKRRSEKERMRKKAQAELGKSLKKSTAKKERERAQVYSTTTRNYSAGKVEVTCVV